MKLKFPIRIRDYDPKYTQLGLRVCVCVLTWMYSEDKHMFPEGCSFRPCLKNFSEKDLGSCTGIVFCYIGRV